MNENRLRPCAALTEGAIEEMIRRVGQVRRAADESLAALDRAGGAIGAEGAAILASKTAAVRTAAVNVARESRHVWANRRRPRSAAASASALLVAIAELVTASDRLNATQAAVLDRKQS